MTTQLTILDIVRVRSTLVSNLVQAIAQHRIAESEKLPHTRKYAASAIADIRHELKKCDEIRDFYENEIVKTVQGFMANAKKEAGL